MGTGPSKVEESSKDSEKIKDIFRKYDLNNDGCISHEELWEVLSKLCPSLTRSEVERLFVKMDANRDQRIQSSEFVDFLFGFADLSDKAEMQMRDAAASSTAAPEGEKYRPSSCEPETLPEEPDLRLKKNDSVLSTFTLDIQGEEPDLSELLERLQQMNAQALREVFQKADVNKKGFLKLNQIRTVLFPANVQTEDQQLAVVKVFAQMDKNSVVNFTLNPQWNFSEVVDIWSPFSIITLRIVDWDRVSQDDPIGFVDFCVADLEPNAPGVRGWLELRKMKRFQSNAKKRFLEHRRLRDDAISDEEVEEDQVQEEAALSPSTMGGFSPSHAAQHAAHAAHHAAHAAQHAAHHAAQHAKQALKRRISSFHLAERQAKLKTTMKLMRGRATRVPRMPCCSGDPKDEDQAAASRRWLSFRRRRKALNAGEVDVSLRLETTCRSLVVKTGVGQPELLYTAVLAPERIREVVKDAEWFACCLPEPAFREQLVSSLGSIKLFAEEVIELLEMLLQVLIIPHVNIVLLIIGWYYKSLSLASLLYFWALIYWCSDMLWTLPLFVLVLFVLLRDRICSNWLLAHPKVVPLNQDGFEMVAFLQNSGGMAVWLKRLVKDRGGWIEDTPELKEFAKRLHHNGKPVLKFPDLLKSLEEKDKTWISWQGKPKKCPHCGQVLEFWGNGAIRLDDGWCCYGLRSKNEDGSRNGRVCAAGLHLSRKQHLGRQRYHCTRCADRASEEELAPGDMCGVCARGGRAYYIASLLKTLNQLPIWRTLLMKAIKEFISDTGPLLEYAQALTKRLLRLMDFLRDPHNDELFKSVCFACISTSMVLYVLNYFLGDLLFTFLLYLLRLGLWIVGTGTFLLFTPPVRRLRTAHNATRLLARCYRWRDRGGCRRWKFFRPSEGEFARPYLRINSVETLDGSDRLFPLSPYGRG